MPVVPTSTSRRGFTLIELLVVIAIIAILAAILFPVFAKAREKARAISCTSNMKQVGLAILQYNQDNDEKFPVGLSTNNVTANYLGQGWAGEVSAYAKSTGVFKCPDDSTPQGTNGTVTIYPVSYAFNSNMAPASLASMNAPASTVMLCEVQGSATESAINLANENGFTQVSPSANGLPGSVGAGVGGIITNINTNTPTTANVAYYTGILGSYTSATTTSGGYAAATGLHTDGSNYLLGDGHAKFLRGAAVSPGLTGTAGQYQGKTANQAAATDTMYLGANSSGPVAATFSPT